MDTTPKSERVTSDPLEPLPQPQTNRSVVSVERQAEAERSPESQSRISYIQLLTLDRSKFLSSGSFLWSRAFLTRRLCLQRRSLRWVTIVALGVGLTRLRTSTAAVSVTMCLPPFLT